MTKGNFQFGDYYMIWDEGRREYAIQLPNSTKILGYAVSEKEARKVIIDYVNQKKEK